MSAQFKVGEVIVGQNFQINVDYNGREGVIAEVRTGVLLMADGEAIKGAYYHVQWANGVIDNHPPHYLRKRHPPSTDDAVSRQAMLDCIERARRGQEVEA